jgi:ABC-type uncharacterized transport system substrate-binding protein
VRIDYRLSGQRYERLPEIASALVRQQVTVIAAAAAGTHTAEIAMAAIKSRPIVFVSDEVPVEAGLVARFNRPDADAAGARDRRTCVGCVRYPALKITPIIWSQLLSVEDGDRCVPAGDIRIDSSR